MDKKTHEALENEHDFNVGMDSLTADLRSLGIEVEIPYYFTEIDLFMGCETQEEYERECERACEGLEEVFSLEPVRYCAPCGCEIYECDRYHHIWDEDFCHDCFLETFGY